MKVLVTGGTGTVGSLVVEGLVERGAQVRALVRKQPEDGKLAREVEIAIGDLADPISVEAAIRGVDKIFLLVANVADELTQALIAFGLAKRLGVRHMTYLSVFRADHFRDVPHFASKLAVEGALRDFGVPFTILRPGYFMQNDLRLQAAILKQGVYPTPLGEAGITMVDVRDIAEAAAISLTRDGHIGKTYDVVSGDSVSGKDAAATWSRLLGRPVRYGGDDVNAFEAQLRERDTPGWLAFDYRTMFAGYQERGFAATSDEAERFARLLGRAPRTYAAFVEEAARQWKEA